MPQYWSSCLFSLQYSAIESESEIRSVVSDSLWPHGLHSPWNSPGQNTGVGSLSLLQGIFPTQVVNPGLPHCRRILYQLSHKGNPRILEWVGDPFSSRSSQPENQPRVSCTAGRFFTNLAIREATILQCGTLESTVIQYTSWHTGAGIQRTGKRSYWLEEGEEAGEGRPQGSSAIGDTGQAAVKILYYCTLNSAVHWSTTTCRGVVHVAMCARHGN